MPLAKLSISAVLLCTAWLLAGSSCTAGDSREETDQQCSAVFDISLCLPESYRRVEWFEDSIRYQDADEPSERTVVLIHQERGLSESLDELFETDLYALRSSCQIAPGISMRELTAMRPASTMIVLGDRAQTVQIWAVQSTKAVAALELIASMLPGAKRDKGETVEDFCLR
jgi:hypothetical protein